MCLCCNICAVQERISYPHNVTFVNSTPSDALPELTTNSAPKRVAAIIVPVSNDVPDVQ